MRAKQLMASVVMPIITAVGVFGGGPLASANTLLDENAIVRQDIVNRIIDDSFDDRLDDSFLLNDRFDYRFDDRFFDDDFDVLDRFRGHVTRLDRDGHAVWVRLANGNVVRVLVDDGTRFGFDNGFDDLRDGMLLDLNCRRHRDNSFRAVSIDRDISLDQDIDIDRDINDGIKLY